MRLCRHSAEDRVYALPSPWILYTERRIPVRAVIFLDREHKNFDPVQFSHVYSDLVFEQLQEIPGLELETTPVYLDELPEKADLTRQAEIIFSKWGMPEISRKKVQEYFPQLKAIFYAGSSIHRFAHPFFDQGVRIFTAGEANATPAAEFTLANILLANKNAFRASRMYRDAAGYQQARHEVETRSGNYHAKVGLIGVGRVGSKVAELLKPFDVEVYAYDPYLTPLRAKELQVTITELEELFSECDVISSHLPSNAQTTRMLNYNLFSLMMPHATFINAALFEPVVEEDLVRALQEVPTRTAILDSISMETDPKNHIFLTMENVILTPHIAGSLGGELERMGELLVEACRDYLSGRPSRHEQSRDHLSVRC